MEQEITLTKYRTDLGLTVDELAKELGISRKELEMWERDEASCPYQRMLELAMHAISIERNEIDTSETDRLIALAEEQSERFKDWEAEYEEDRKRQEAFFIEHEQWCKEHGLPIHEWRYPGDRENSEP